MSAAVDLDAAALRAEVQPFGSAALAYFEAGWAPLPVLGANGKAPVPAGFTGWTGADASRGQVLRWIVEHPAANIAVRLPDGVVAVDVDDYDGHPGGASIARFCAQHGAPPPTVCATARPLPSGKYVYVVPVGTVLRASLGPGVDIVQRTHRYCVVWPSVHATAGLVRWVDVASGEALDRVPDLDDLPALPWSWIETLSVAKGPAQPAATGDQVAAFLASYTGPQRPSARLDAIVDTLRRAQPGGRHDAALWTLCRVTEAAAAGDVDAATGLDAVRDAWRAVAGADREDEFTGMLRWAVGNAGTASPSRDTATPNGPATNAANRSGPDPQDWVGRLDPSRVRFDADFWNADDGADWLVEPVVPAHRGTAIVAAAKAGKSLVMLELAAALATGRPVLDRPAGDPIAVVYLDCEMGPADLRERLSDMGYGPSCDLSHLAYYTLPSLPPLDTAAGGVALCDIAEHHQAALIVLDTLARVISGEENAADTIAAFFRHTAMPLKAAGRAVVRLDHLGKDVTKGARGTSAKAADVDLAWTLTPTDEGIRLTRAHSRVSWVPERVDLRRHEDPLRHELVIGGWPAGTAEAADLLDELDVPVDASRRAAAVALREAGEGRRTEVLLAALRYRRSPVRVVREPPREPLGSTVGNHARNQEAAAQ